MHTQLLVLGGGPGGYAAAFLAADLGMDVTLVNNDPNLGGTCLLRGCIPSKALLHVAKIITESKEMDEWGVTFKSPKIDINAMRARKQKVIDTLSKGLNTLATKRKIKFINAKGVFEASQRLRLEGGDPKTHPENHCLTFDHCIVAVGSSPAVPKAFELGTDRVMDSTGALALKDIPKSMLIVGGGYIGLEMGTIYASIGSQVSVVEMLPNLLPGADADLVKPLQKRLGELFHAIHLKTKVAKLEDQGDYILASFDNGEKQWQEKFDRVLVSIGRKPNTQGLGLENTAVTINERGFIEVNDKQQTSDAAILAIGDIVGDPMLAHKASHEGRVAVEVLAGEPAAMDPAAIPAVIFTDPEIAWAGLTESQAKIQSLDVQIAVYPWAASGRAQAIGRPQGLTKLIIDSATERILGIGIVGVGAGELIAEGVLAIEMGATVRDLTESIHPHPTMSETVSHAGTAYFGTATEIYRPKRTRKH